MKNHLILKLLALSSLFSMLPTQLKPASYKVTALLGAACMASTAYIAAKKFTQWHKDLLTLRKQTPESLQNKIAGFQDTMQARSVLIQNRAPIIAKLQPIQDVAEEVVNRCSTNLEKYIENNTDQASLRLFAQDFARLQTCMGTAKDRLQLEITENIGTESSQWLKESLCAKVHFSHPEQGKTNKRQKKNLNVHFSDEIKQTRIAYESTTFEWKKNIVEEMRPLSTKEGGAKKEYKVRKQYKRPDKLKEDHFAKNSLLTEANVPSNDQQTGMVDEILSHYHAILASATIIEQAAKDKLPIITFSKEQLAEYKQTLDEYKNNLNKYMLLSKEDQVCINNNQALCDTYSKQLNELNRQPTFYESCSLQRPWLTNALTSSSAALTAGVIGVVTAYGLQQLWHHFA